MKAKDLWEEFIVFVRSPDPAMPFDIPLCGLCGNSGFVDTTKSAKCWGNVPAGIKAYCICPNGRANKKAQR